MGEQTTVKAADGFELDAWLERPDGDPRGAIVVIQEIFGVNQHIREVAAGFAGEGYIAIAPAIFDRAEKGVELGYDEAGIKQGAGIARGKLDMNKTLADLQAAIDDVAHYGKVGVVGYCFGGLLAWLCAARADKLACAVGYYGGGIANSLDVTPKVPTMLHFGERDAHIPMSDVDKIKQTHPDVTVHVYDADHGFNCDHRGSYDEAAAKLARQRTLEFFAANL